LWDNIAKQVNINISIAVEKKWSDDANMYLDIAIYMQVKRLEACPFFAARTA